jgi:hypothetical protein
MSISNISHSIISSATFSNHENNSVNLEAKFQDAFESLNFDLILDLLSKGANPNQKILCTEKMHKAFCKMYVDMYYDREEFIEGFLQLDFENIDFEDIDDPEIVASLKEPGGYINRLTLLQKDLRNNLPVSDEQIKELMYEEAVGQSWDCYQEAEGPIKEDIYLTPMQIAEEFDQDDLIQRLLDKGAETNN